MRLLIVEPSRGGFSSQHQHIGRPVVFLIVLATGEVVFFGLKLDP